MTRLRSARAGALLVSLLAICGWLPAQTIPSNPSTDPTILRQFIVFARHGVRSAALPSSTLAAFAARQYPEFGVPTGYLTPNGAKAETLMGSYFRAYLLSQGLISGNDSADSQHAYFRANSIQRSNISAQSRAAGLFPNATTLVYSYPLGKPDPVFDPIAAGTVVVDPLRAVQETNGKYKGAALQSALSAEYSLIRSVLFNYPYGTTPPPPVPANLVDPTSLPIPLTANTSNVQTVNVINAGGLANTLYAADPFVMQYTDGMPMQNVAWGQMSLAQISQQTRIITLDFAIEMGTPYLNQLQSSNAAAHILRSMEQAVTGRRIPGAFTDRDKDLLVVSSSDAYIMGVANLLDMHWVLPGYQPDYIPPGGSLVFELRQVISNGEYIVRAYFTSQTFDQLRNLTPLTADVPPATMQLLIPGGSQSPANLDVSFATFRKLVNKAINPYYVQDPASETPPGPLSDVPLK